MKKKHIPSIIILLLILFNFTTYYKHSISLKQNESLKKESSISKERIKEIESLYTNNHILGKANENLKLNPSLKLIDYQGDTVTLKSILKSNKIIFRYSKLNCDKCIDAEFKILEKFSEKISDELIIISFYDRVRGLIYTSRRLRDMGLNKVKIYSLIDNKLFLPLDDYNTPFYFALNENFRASNFFVPEKQNAKLTEAYLKFSLDNFFD